MEKRKEDDLQRSVIALPELEDWPSDRPARLEAMKDEFAKEREQKRSTPAK